MAAAENTTDVENGVEWAKKDNRRLLHVVYRVGDLDKTIKFYTECLGMTLLRKRDIPEDKYTNAFLGYGPEDSHFVVELTYNYGVGKYDLGTGFGHFGIAVDDVYKAVELVKAKEGKVSREPGPVKGGHSVIAFVEDPDGYKFELIQRGPTPEPLCQVMLRVGDLNRSIDFYQKAFGMELLRTRDNPEQKYTIAMLGYGAEDKTTVLELTYNYGITEYERGNAYTQIAIGTDDVYKTAEVIREAGGKITREPGPLPGLKTKIMACLDPDGWKSEHGFPCEDQAHLGPTPFHPEQIQSGVIDTTFCRSEDHVADIFTKALNKDKFDKFKLSLGVVQNGLSMKGKCQNV